MKRNILTPILLFAMIFLIGCTKEETPHPKTVILDEKIALLYEGVPDYEYGTVTIGPFTYNYHDYIETKQIDPSQSFIRCRHQGWTYAYNVETGNLQNN